MYKILVTGAAGFIGSNLVEHLLLLGQTKAQTLLGYHPTHKIEEGLDAALEWYKKNVVLA